MSPHAFTRRTLVTALGALLLGAAGQALASRGDAPAEPPNTLLVFGDPSHIEHAGDLAAHASPIVDGAALSAPDIERFADPAARAIAVVAARDLVTLAARPMLMHLFDRGVPVFVCVDDDSRADVARVFGIAPPGGDALYVRQSDGEVAVLGNTGPEAHWSPRWSRRAASAAMSFRPSVEADAIGNDTPQASGLPMVTFHEGLIDTGTDDITGRAVIKVLRTSTRTEDDKEIHVHAWPIITPKNAGIFAGHDMRPAVNLSAAYLPWVYRVSHRMSADGVQPQMVDSLPESDGRTSIDYEQVKRRSINIGGGTGEGASADGQPDAGLAAKLPFNLSFSYQNETTETIRYSFTDYSMLARPVDGGQATQWEARIAPKLENVLLDNVRADSVKLTEARMTPMMRSATFDTWSVWELPGSYEGTATVEIEGGYELNEKKWWWDRSNWRSSNATVPVSVKKRYVLDMSHPFLTREITVLVRSAFGNGGCLAQMGDNVSIATCDPSSRTQMWGLDSESRYVNRSSGLCLTADPARDRLTVGRCTLGNDQRWEWRADRLHSRFDDGRHRLFVDGGTLRVDAAGRFEDTPSNPHNAILPPWSGYPRAPVAGELIPAPFNTAAGLVPASWERSYGAVGPEQRWSVVVLRAGLTPEL